MLGEEKLAALYGRKIRLVIRAVLRAVAVNTPALLLYSKVILLSTGKCNSTADQTSLPCSIFEVDTEAVGVYKEPRGISNLT